MAASGRLGDRRRSVEQADSCCAAMHAAAPDACIGSGAGEDVRRGGTHGCGDSHSCGGSHAIHPAAFRCIRTSARLGGKAGEIMQSARSLFERDGVQATSIAAVAKEAGVARGLVYYYFPDKQSLVDAVVDDYIEDVLDTIGIWNESRVFGDTPGELLHCVAAFRRVLFDASGHNRPMFGVIDELGIRDEFGRRAVLAAVECIHHDVVMEYAAYHSIAIESVPEMFAMVLYGVAGVLRAYPDITDEQVAQLVAQSLHLDMRVIDPPPWRSGQR